MVLRNSGGGGRARLCVLRVRRASGSSLPPPWPSSLVATAKVAPHRARIPLYVRIDRDIAVETATAAAAERSWCLAGRPRGRATVAPATIVPESRRASSRRRRAPISRGSPTRTQMRMRAPEHIYYTHNTPP